MDQQRPCRSRNRVRQSSPACAPQRRSRPQRSLRAARRIIRTVALLSQRFDPWSDLRRIDGDRNSSQSSMETAPPRIGCSRSWHRASRACCVDPRSGVHCWGYSGNRRCRAPRLCRALFVVRLPEHPPDLHSLKFTGRRRILRVVTPGKDSSLLELSRDAPQRMIRMELPRHHDGSLLVEVREEGRAICGELVAVGDVAAGLFPLDFALLEPPPAEQLPILFVPRQELESCLDARVEAACVFCFLSLEEGDQVRAPRGRDVRGF